MNIAVVGYGSQGKSAVEYWLKQGNTITICDQSGDVSPPAGVNLQHGDNYLDNLNQFDLIVRSPIIHPSLLKDVDPDKITSNTNEFFRVCPTKNIIGVTGTKGKGTTSTLITKMLEASGNTVHLGGNIGIPPLELLKNNISPEDWVVLELANFQLIDLKYSPMVAVCLMIEPEHLDWHTNVDEYFDAKKQLFCHQTDREIAIYHGLNQQSSEIARSGSGKLVPYMCPPGAAITNGSLMIDEQMLCTLDDVALAGAHNLENICAAATAVWQIEPSVQPIAEVVSSFKGLPFRIEFRDEKNGIKFYNDSFASAPGATVAAIHTVPGDKVLIIGGRDRHLDLLHLIDAINQNREAIVHIVLVGESASRVALSLDEVGFSRYSIYAGSRMTEIVNEALDHAAPNSSIVLSPGFPSFDMFKNFEDRGNQFNQVVRDL